MPSGRMDRPRGGGSPRCQIACVRRPQAGGNRTHNPIAYPYRPRTRLSADFHRPAVPGADSRRPTGAQRGFPPPHRRAARIPAAPPACSADLCRRAATGAGR
ncbi:hypothetical protein Apa02nite_024350 [Actinoplanes palleronii]|uniref:Uncharacterized protein n=1 Tax=Actinoplanes palleronii TaxID=113570 RepID=A0ABQ4B6V8_9ACTN|nr:hypothetical protein Apa02nite_024350 [Actinoplanes palleronii]